MICPLCGGLITLPAVGEPAICVPCNVVFKPVADVGWFGESIIVYALEP